MGGEARKLRQIPVLARSVVPGYPVRNIDTQGFCMTGQMYVQEYLLAKPRCEIPVLLWHGGGMTGAQWESTPDQRPGWLMSLLSRGFNVLVCDAAERGRSSWNPSVLGNSTQVGNIPILRTAEEAWVLFRIGLLEDKGSALHFRTSFKNQQFPVSDFDQFISSFVPRWFDHEKIERDAYAALLEKVDRAIIVAHSQGGGHALSLAQQFSKKIEAIIAIEPTGVPSKVNASIPPHLAVWGDYFEQSPVWNDYRERARSYWSQCKLNGSRMDSFELPQSGIFGNSHFPMLDKNSENILDLIVDWLSSQ